MPGVAAQMFKVLADEGINIEMIATSEIKVSVVVNAEVRRARDARVARRLSRTRTERRQPRRRLMIVALRAKKSRSTTPRLRDGCQSEDVSLTVEDKFRLRSGSTSSAIDYIEGGWPGSNERDAAFFKEIKRIKLQHAKIVAFGSTRRAGMQAPSADRNLQLILQADTPSRPLSARPGTCTCARRCEFRAEANLEILHDTIAYLKKHI